MDIDQWIKIVPVVTTIVFGASTLWLSIKQSLDGNKSSRREEYKFAKIFFEDMKANSEMHPFVRKKGFQAIGRDQNLSTTVIEHLMKFSDPVVALNDYEASKSYLQEFDELGLAELSFTTSFLWATQKRRKLLSNFYLVCAGLFYSFAFTPWFLFTLGKISATASINSSIVFLPIGIFGAIVFVREFIQLRLAMRLINAQNNLVISEVPVI